MRSESKVGLFALIALVVIGFITLKVGSRSFVAAGGYDVTLIMDNAIGLRTKTPVEIAGIKVGQVKNIELVDSRRAKLTLLISKDVVLPQDTQARLRSKGFLGEVVIELVPGIDSGVSLADGSSVQFAGQSGDVNMLITQFNSIANDIKAVSSSLKDMAGNDQNSPVWTIVKNLESFTQTLANNQENFNKMAGNLAALTESLRGTIVKSKENVEDSLARIASITKKVDEGQGTVGKLVNDDTTITKLNEAVDNLNNALGGLNRMQTEIGYHTEYLANSEQFKQYVHLTLKPKPDKAFMFDFVTQQNPSPSFSSRTTNITAGGTTSTVHTNSEWVDRNQFRFSAQIAKKFYDLTLRGGIIESRGGFGFDYEKGPLQAQFSAFNFQTDYGQRPDLKLGAVVNLTNNIYLTGGAEDMINKQYGPDWFFGAGLRFADEDIKSLLGLAAGSSMKK